MRAYQPFGAQLPGMLLIGPIASTPQLWPGDKIRDNAGPAGEAVTGVVVRRHWFGRVTVLWDAGGFTTLRGRDLSRGDVR